MSAICRRNAADVPAKYKGESWARLGVDVDNGFHALYVVSRTASSRSPSCTKLAKEVDEIFLATDEDREGEAIAWHLVETIKPKVPVKRMVFHEITKAGDPGRGRQPARDRPRPGRRAGGPAHPRPAVRLRGQPGAVEEGDAPAFRRPVQSVATRIVVERERQRMAFRSAEYWDINATLAVQGEGRRVRVTSTRR
jgi:DNA topoisomerase-1